MYKNADTHFKDYSLVKMDSKYSNDRIYYSDDYYITAFVLRDKNKTKATALQYWQTY